MSRLDAADSVRLNPAGPVVWATAVGAGAVLMTADRPVDSLQAVADRLSGTLKAMIVVWLAWAAIRLVTVRPA